MKYEATSACPVGAEWPRGIHWSAGEVRDVPAEWPGSDETPPAWLKPEKRRSRRKAPPADGG